MGNQSGRPKIAAVDLFCGAAGLTLGLQKSGIEIVAGIDLDPACRHPFEANIGAKFVNCDIAKMSGEFVQTLFGENKIRVLAGCAPCQPFSGYFNLSQAILSLSVPALASVSAKSEDS